MLYRKALADRCIAHQRGSKLLTAELSLGGADKQEAVNGAILPTGNYANDVVCEDIASVPTLTGRSIP